MTRYDYKTGQTLGTDPAVKHKVLERFGSVRLDEAYFKTFDLERVCIDKVFFVVYDKQYSIEEHDFDFYLRDRFIQHVKRSRVKKGRFEEVIRMENNYSAWELRLKDQRTMYFHVNVIHFLQELHEIHPKNVIYDDNFMPTDCKLTVADYVGALRRFVQDAKKMYHDLVKEYWNVDLVNVEAKLSQVEIPFEVYPGSVDDIAQKLYAKGISFRKYNTQSATIYLNDVKFDNEYQVHRRKYEKSEGIDEQDMNPDIVYMNGINSGRNSNKIQVKIYQKTFGLCRIEFTVYSKDASILFGWKRTDNEISEDLISFIHYNLRIHDINVERYDRSLDDVVQYLAKAHKESEDLIYSLKDVDVFETCKASRAVQQRLTRKGILLPVFDDNGTRKRGAYVVNPIIRDFLNMYKAKGSEHFTKNSLYPRL